MFKKLVLFITLLIPIYLVAGIPLSSNFTVNTALPIEDRMSVADIAARDAISSLRRWEGMLVYVVADGKHYTLIGGITNGDWSEISGSGGAGSGLLSFVFSGVASDIATYYQAPSVSSYVSGSLTTVPTVVGTSATLMGVFATNVGFPNVTSIPTGFFTAHYETDKVAGANNYYTYFEVYKRTVGGVETLLATSDQTTQTAVNTLVQQTASAIIVAPVSLLATDRVIVKIYGVLLTSSATIDLLFDDTTNARLELPSATVDATNFVPYVGATKDLNLGNNNIIAANYDKDNLLVNGNIENPLSTEWTCTVGTCTRTTTAGQFSKDTAALSVALTAQAMNVSQTVTTPSGIQKQGFVRVIYRVPATMADFQICSLVDAAEQTCIPTANLIKDDTFRSAEIPLTFGSTSAGIKFKTTSSYTANAYFDGNVVAQGLGTQNLQGDTVYSAQVDGTVSPSTVSDENKDWLNGNCTRTATGIWDCPVITGTFTTVPNCFATRNIAATAAGFSPAFDRSLSTVTSLRFHLANELGTAVNSKFDILCQKSGNDYLAASSNVYASQNANYSRTAYQPTLTGFGSSVPAQDCYHSRDGEYLVLECNLTAGTTPTAVEARVSLPNSLVAQAFASTTVVGEWYLNSVNTVHGGAVLMTASTGYVTFSNFGVYGSTSINPFSTATGSTLLPSAGLMSFKARVPISGWSNANYIVGSFENVPIVPGAGARIDTFSVSYGTTNLATVCSASPCFIDQIGTGVTSITRAGTGDYTLNVSKTYTKLRCNLTLSQNGNSAVTLSPMSCNNCSSIQFTTYTISPNAIANTLGSIICQGSY